MRALVLHQPWATLVAIGLKRLETRGWATPYLGPLLVLAARTDAGPVLPSAVAALNAAGWQENPACRVAAGPRRLRPLPLGAVVAIVEHQGTVPTENVRFDGTPGSDWIVVASAGRPPIVVSQDDNRPLGDFTAGRHAWLWADVRPLPEPVPARGRQGLWTPDAELVAATERAAA